MSNGKKYIILLSWIIIIAMLIFSLKAYVVYYYSNQPNKLYITNQFLDSYTVSEDNIVMISEYFYVKNTSDKEISFEYYGISEEDMSIGLLKESRVKAIDYTYEKDERKSILKNGIFTVPPHYETGVTVYFQGEFGGIELKVDRLPMDKHEVILIDNSGDIEVFHSENFSKVYKLIS